MMDSSKTMMFYENKLIRPNINIQSVSYGKLIK